MAHVAKRCCETKPGATGEPGSRSPVPTSQEVELSTFAEGGAKIRPVSSRGSVWTPRENGDDFVKLTGGSGVTGASGVASSGPGGASVSASPGCRFPTERCSFPAVRHKGAYRGGHYRNGYNRASSQNYP